MNQQHVKPFNPTDKVTILKNTRNTAKPTPTKPNQTQSKLFWSESLMKFNLNYDELWKSVITEQWPLITT